MLGLFQTRLGSFQAGLGASDLPFQRGRVQAGQHLTQLDLLSLFHQDVRNLAAGGKGKRRLLVGDHVAGGADDLLDGAPRDDGSRGRHFGRGRLELLPPQEQNPRGNQYQGHDYQAPNR